MHLCAALCSSLSWRAQSDVTAPSVCVVLLRQDYVGAGELPSENVSSSNSVCQQTAMSRHGSMLAIRKPRMVARVDKYRINGKRDVPSLQCYVLTWSLDTVPRSVMVLLYPRSVKWSVLNNLGDSDGSTCTGLFWSSHDALLHYLPLNFNSLILVGISCSCACRMSRF